MFRRKKYLLNPSHENHEVLLKMSKLVEQEYERILNLKMGMTMQSAYLDYFHYSSRQYLIHYLSSEIKKKRSMRDPFCIFASGSYEIEKGSLILKVGRQFCYLNDEMRIPFLNEQKVDEIKGSLKITLKNEKWWAVFTYHSKKI